MAYSAKIVLDSIGHHGKRLTTFELTYPRMVHSEFLTHSVIRRNSSSSRAIPISVMMQQVEKDPVIPVWIGKHQPGMQAHEELQGQARENFLHEWIMARDSALRHAEVLQACGAHKQLVNRILEPWMWITIIATATEYNNFFNLRTDKMAQPEIKRIADMMVPLYYENTPTLLEPKQWHLPLLREEDWPDIHRLSGDNNPIHIARQVSVARCARVSYLTHDGRRDIQEDIKLFERLVGPGHWSPFEHVCMCAPDGNTKSGAFEGWIQFRKWQFNENRTSFNYEVWKEQQRG